MPALETTAGGESRVTIVLDWLFVAWRLPAFIASLLGLYEVLLVVILLVPAGDGGFGSFADEFRRSCLGFYEGSGHPDALYTLTVALEPLVILGGVIFLWGTGLIDAGQLAPTRLLPSFGLAVVVLALGATSLVRLRRANAAAPVEFPGADLRTARPAPAFTFVDQDGTRVESSGFQGKVVVLTGVYTGCSIACPLILRQAKEALAGLSPQERSQVTVFAVTLDVEHDTVPHLAAMAQRQGVQAPLFHLVTGEPTEVDRVLQQLEIPHKRDPQTGVIDHANVFVVVDRKGRAAYRFTLGERQEQWLASALRQLVGEAP